MPWVRWRRCCSVTTAASSVPQSCSSARMCRSRPGSKVLWSALRCSGPCWAHWAAVPPPIVEDGMLTMPDTTRSLIRRGYAEQGRAVLVGLRGDTALAEREFTEIIELERQQHDTGTGARLSSPWVRRLLLLGALLAIFQQITG